MRRYNLIMTKVLIAVFWVTMALSPVSAAEVYRSVDQHGNPVFSGQPQPGSEKIKVQPTNVQSLPPVRRIPARRPPTQQAANRYQSLSILSPTNDTTLRNITQLGISVSISPVLLGQHSLVLLDNGQPVGEPGRSLSMSIKELHRGTHVLQVKVVDAQGQTLISSETVTIHAHRPSVLHPNSPNSKIRKTPNTP